ncbi:ATPase family associated with various cellular activities (AAA) [Teratosphaeria destructans]|uniref:ATPase family associated with various cellular activities (AAA) n=1 Tax=Teratosphaeria destructans TaxID=418781 RepID=A0A9W7VZG5_9PEZI|nr:ATPase family associated with various cellular activities (AAA) [Teratosphaeria destructans]
MRPIARQSARLASHPRSASCGRVRQSTAQRSTALAAPQQSRCFSASIQRSSEPRAPGDHEAWLAEQREQQRRAEAEKDKTKPEQATGAGNGEATGNGNGNGEVRRSMRDRTLMRRRRHTDVPKPPPIPDWFLRQNVTLVKETDSASATAEERQVMRCVDVDTGHTLFTLPHYGFWPDDVPPASERITTTIRGQEIDVTALGMDATSLPALPEVAREELVTRALIDHRAKDPKEVDLVALGELLVSLPRDLQKDVLRTEIALQKRRRGEEDGPVKQPQLGSSGESLETQSEQTADRTQPISISQIPEILEKNFFSQHTPQTEVQPPPQPSSAECANLPVKGTGTPNPTGLSAASWAFLEAETSIRAAFALAQDGLHTFSFASSRVDLSLLCRDSNAHKQMDDVVAELANNVRADLITIDSNDIEELATDYVGHGRDDPGSFYRLGYDVYHGYIAHKSNPGFLDFFGPPQDENLDMQEDEVDEDEEEDDVEDHESMNGPPKSGLMTIEQLRKALHNKRHSLNKALSGIGISGITIIPGPPPGMNGLGPIAPRPPRSVPSSDAAKWDDERLGALLDSILDAPAQKMQKGDAVDSPPSTQSPSDSMPKPTFHPALFRAQAAESLMVSMRESNPVSLDATGTRLEYETIRATDHRNAQSDARRTIVHVRDLRDICRSRLGNAVVERLVQIVQKRRKAGQLIIIVGTTAEDHDNLFMSGSREPEDSFFRGITIPPSNGKHDSPLIPSLVSSLSKTYVESGYSRILEINLRHIRTMLRRLRPDQEVDLTTQKALKQMVLRGTSMLADRVLSLTQVQRVLLTALGLASEHAKSSIVQPIHIALACDITAKVDHVAQRATSSNGTSRSQPSSFEGGSAAKSGSSSPNKGNRRSKVDAVRPKCNQHEQRLLNGVADAENIKVGFADVHATPGTIDALKTLTTLSLMRPEAFSYGVLAADRLPGLLLYGPPGTGKTLLAKAVAKESKATVLEVSGAQIYEKYVGEGEKMVRAVFSLAKKLSPCIVFIDEADAIFGSRSNPGNRNTHREIINQFLREWDGMDDHGVFMMVASNRPFDLDDAVLRRLPRRLLVDLPVAKDREAILGIHLKNEQIDSSVDLAKLAERTPFYSGSDLKNLAVSAALAAVREENDLAAANASNADFKLPEKRTLSSKHFEKAITEISASVSEDMASLTAIRKFDEQFGDRKGRRKKSSYGFGPTDAVIDESSVLVRQAGAQPSPGPHPGPPPAP